MLISRSSSVGENTTTITVSSKVGGEESTDIASDAMPLTPTKSSHIGGNCFGSCNNAQLQQEEDRQLQVTPPHDPQHGREEELPNSEHLYQPIVVGKHSSDSSHQQPMKLVERKQPFFMMDWLEDLMKDQDVEKIATMLQTPQKHYPPTSSSSSVSSASPFWMTPPQSPPPNQVRRSVEASKSANDIDCLHNRPVTPKSSNRKKSVSMSRLHLPYRPAAVDSPSRLGASSPTASCQARNERSSSSIPPVTCPSPTIKRELFPEEEILSPPVLPSWVAATSEQSLQSTSCDADENRSVPSSEVPSSGRCDNERKTPNTPTEGSNQKQTTSTPSSTVSSSPFYKKSIAIGNGWNAKGLRKAKQGLWQDALSCWDNALEIRSQLLGDWHLDVANTCNNRGIALGKLGRWETARKSLERALEIQIHVFGCETHDQVASTIHNLANVYHQAGELEGAIRLFCRSKQVQQALCDKIKYQEKQALAEKEEKDDNMGVEPKELADENDASTDREERVRRNAAKASPPPELQVARACIAMGHVYYEARQYQDAREAYWDAWQIYDKVGLSNEDPQVVQVKRDISDIDVYFENQRRQEERRRQEEEQQRRAAAVASAAAAAVVYPPAFSATSPTHRIAASWSTPSPFYNMIAPPSSTTSTYYYDAVESLGTPTSYPVKHSRTASGNPMVGGGTMAMPSPHQFSHQTRVLQF